MRALVYTGPGALEMRDVPDPVAGEGKVLVAVAHSGICGSDMHALRGHDDRRPAPLILGHEAAGAIRGGPRDGDRVTVNPLVSCGACPACRAGRDNLCPDRQIISLPPREGAFAPLVAMPEANLVAVPDGTTTAVAALAEPVACGWHATRLGLERPGPADRALVLGGGAIGVGAALSLRAQGVAAVTLAEPNAVRRKGLSRADLRDVAVVPEAEGDDYDLVVDAVGIDATREVATAAARPGGTVLHIGLGGGRGGLDVRRMTLQEIAVIGTYTYTAQDFRDAAAAMFSGRLGALDWTEERPLADGARAFADIRDGRVAAAKVLLVP